MLLRKSLFFCAVCGYYLGISLQNVQFRRSSLDTERTFRLNNLAISR